MSAYIKVKIREKDMKNEVDILANVSVKDFIKSVTSDDKSSLGIDSRAGKNHVILNISVIDYDKESSIQINLNHCTKNANLQELLRYNYEPISLKKTLELGFKIEVVVVPNTSNIATSNQLDTIHQKLDINPGAFLAGHGSVPLSMAQRKKFDIEELSVVSNATFFQFNTNPIISNHFDKDSPIFKSVKTSKDEEINIRINHEFS